MLICPCITDDPEIGLVKRLADRFVPALATADIRIRHPGIDVLNHALEPSVQSSGNRPARLALHEMKTFTPGGYRWERYHEAEVAKGRIIAGYRRGMRRIGQ